MTTAIRRGYWLEHEDKFFLFIDGGFENVQGKPIQINGWGELDLFLVHREPLGFAVVCGITGTIFSSHYPMWVSTAKKAVASATKHLKTKYTNRSQLMETRHYLLERHGLSPRYRFEDEESECPTS